MNTMTMTPVTPDSPEAQTAPCWKCRGTGAYATSFGLRTCFTCNGKGRIRVKDPAARAEKLNERNHTRGEFAQQYAAEIAHLQHDAAKGSDFADSLLRSLNKYGTLTPNQLAAVQRGMAKLEARANPASADDLPAEVDVSALSTAMLAAKASGLKYVGMDLGSFTFSLAPDHGKNPGAIYVKAERVYLGKVMAGKFSPSRDCDADTQADIVWAASHPHEAAVAYGKKTGRCSCCGRELTDPVSIAAGIGPVCAKRFGWLTA